MRAARTKQKTKNKMLEGKTIQVQETELAGAEHLRAELDRFAAALPLLDDSALLIRSDRER